MTPTVAVLLALVAAIAWPTAGGAPQHSPIGCSSELLAMSSCLPYVSAPPNNATTSPSPGCCEAFSAAALTGAGGGAACLCYLVRDPKFFGFPVDTSRIASLFSSCVGFSDNAIAATAAASSFMKICRGSKVLPPLRGPPAGDLDRSVPPPAGHPERSFPPPAGHPDRSFPSPAAGTNASVHGNESSSHAALPPPLVIPKNSAASVSVCYDRVQLFVGAVFLFLFLISTPLA